ncbi:LPAAT1A [Auxenochlorella protothecoides x Auxenochlorella symbiontica]
MQSLRQQSVSCPATFHFRRRGHRPTTSAGQGDARRTVAVPARSAPPSKHALHARQLHGISAEAHPLRQGIVPAAAQVQGACCSESAPEADGRDSEVLEASSPLLPCPDEPTGPLNDTTHASKPLAVLRAFFFYVVTFAVATPILLILLLQLPIVLLFDKHRRRAQHVWNTVWARLSAWPFYRVEMTGLEHLPPSDCAAVYVANHQSFLDITTLFHIRRDFKFISKTSNFLIPIIGWTMYLTGHVKIDRMDSRSQMQCLKECGDLLSSGASVLFFPEGTRSKDGKLHAFKKGAFSVAAKRKVPVVPITLQGTGELMPVGAEGRLFSGTIKVRVHPAVPPSQAVAMMAAAQAAVASGLPRDKLGPDVLQAVQS